MKSRILKDFYITVPKRSEVIHPINTTLNEDSLILNKELQKGNNLTLQMKTFN